MNNNTNIKVIIAGGGTGGHIFPAVAIANALKKQNANNEILFVGALGKMEMEKVPKEGYNIIGLPIAGFNRSNLLKNITLPFKLIKSMLMAKKVLKEFKPNIVIGVGGYASFPMLKAAQQAGIPTLIQEQNSHAGKSNINLGKKANAICVAYAGMEKFFTPIKIIHTGNPVRHVITNSTVTKNDAKIFFNLHNHKPTLLIIGGSLGAQSINNALVPNVKAILDKGYQILWQTGKLSYPTIANVMQDKSEDVKVHEFVKDMDKAYAAADIVISRAGALSIAELCIVAKPVVFVPYPHAAEDHQTVNANSLVAKQAALLVADNTVSEKLLPTLLSLMDNTALQQQMHIQLKQLAIVDADQRIVNEIYKIVNAN